MNKYKVKSSDGHKQVIKADSLEIRDDMRVVFYNVVSKDPDPSGLEVVAVFAGPISIEKMEDQE